MDKRLIPLNGLIALLRGEGKWPGLLRDQDWQRHQFEVPISTSLGNFRADAVIFRADPPVVLLAECKGGRNIEEDQARKYLAATLDDLRRAGALPIPLRNVRETQVKVLFVGLEEERASLERGLRELSVDAPLLTIGRKRVRLSGASSTPGLDDFDERHEGGLPPARFRVDHQSPQAEIEELLVPLLAAAQARRVEFLGLEAISAELLPEWPLLAFGARGAFRDRVQDALRRLGAGLQRRDFRYEPRSATIDGRVVFLQTPAQFDPRGATRAWQAVQGRASRALGRQPQPAIEGQLSLEDLADEGGIAEE